MKCRVFDELLISDRLVGGRIKTSSAPPQSPHPDIRSPRWRQDQNTPEISTTGSALISDRLVGGRIKTPSPSMKKVDAGYQIASLEAGSKLRPLMSGARGSDIRSPRWRQDQNMPPSYLEAEIEISDRLVGGRIKTARRVGLFPKPRYQIASLEAGSKLDRQRIPTFDFDIRSPRWRQDQNSASRRCRPSPMISDRLVGGRIKTHRTSAPHHFRRYQIASLEAGSKPFEDRSVRIPDDIRSPRWRQDQNTFRARHHPRAAISDRLVGGRIKTRLLGDPVKRARYQIASLEAGSKQDQHALEAVVRDIRSPRWRQDQNVLSAVAAWDIMISDRLVGGRIKT